MKQITSNNQLLESREKNLQNIQNGLIKAHGKLWNMDVFSWINPNINALTQTIHSFPFPIYWISSSNLIHEAKNIDSSISSNIQRIFIISEHNQTITSLLKNIIISKENISEAFDEIAKIKPNKGIILFCTEGTDGELHQNQFKAFLNIHQI